VPAVRERLAARLDDVLRRPEIGRADVQMDDGAPFALERGDAVDDLEGGLGAEAVHAAGEFQARFQVRHVKPRARRRSR
jgi:hypothetical protein